MVTFLFWNLNRKVLTEEVAQLCADRLIDVVVLAECDSAPEQYRDAINNVTGREFHLTESRLSRLQLLTALGRDSFRECYVNASGKLSLRRMVFSEMELLLALVHLKSEMWWERKELSIEAYSVAGELRNEVFSRKNGNTCVVGDFNLQPFEDGMTAATGFHAMMAQSCLEQEFREVQGRLYRPMYNPMWGCFGDRTPGPSGTFFRKDASPICFDWHVFDQVLYSRPILPYLANHGEIVDRIGGVDLLGGSNRPQKQFSDHLPILFSLTLTRPVQVGVQT